jgi:hypothetical protein
MALTVDDIRAAAAAFASPGGCTLGTQQVRAAATYTDGWIDDNRPDYKTGLPEPFKTNATNEQKALLFVYVVLKQGGII